MNPILFESTENNFDTNGIGILADTIFCEVTYERNGILELEMQYPITGIHYKEIKTRNIILASPNPVENTQPFRIYRITKPINGIITIYGRHISYDLSGIPVSPFTAGSAAEAMSKLQSSAAIESPFTFWTDKETIATMSVVAPASTRSLLGGQQGSVLDVYGGEYQFDRYTVRLYNQRGMNRGVSIRYGKNLTSLEQDENISSVYTGVYPYWMDTDNNLVTLPEKILNAPGTYNFTRIMALDLSQEFESAPTEEQLRNRANTYMTANNIGVPKVSLDVSFIQLEQTEEYKNIVLLERVELCDTVNVEFPELGVSATAKCVKTVYDVLQERYKSVELGEARTNIADTIADQQQKIEKTPTTSAMQKAINNATNWLTSADGYVIAVKDDNGTWKEILFLDTPSAETAKNVLRINTNGIGFSTNGVNGPYRNAWTIDGSLVADFITTGTLNAALAKIINIDATNINTGTLNADLIKAGNIKSKNGISNFDLSTGIQTYRMATNLLDGYDVEMYLWANSIKFRAINQTTGESYELASIYASLPNSGSNQKLAGSVEANSIWIRTPTYAKGITGVYGDVRADFDSVDTIVFNGKTISWTYSNELGKYVLTGA